MTGSFCGRALSVVVGSLLVASSAAAQAVPQLDSYDGVAVRILQSNNAGTIQHVIDPELNEVVGLIRGCPNPHNLTMHPDALYYYCANEQDHTVDVFDTKTLELVEQIELSQRPNKVAVNKKHRKIYAGIARRSTNPLGPGVEVDPNRTAPALIDVIDIDTHETVKSIEVHYPVHNVFMTPDERWVVAGLRGEAGPDDPTIQVIDPRDRHGGLVARAEWIRAIRPDAPHRATDGLRGERRRVDQTDLRAGDRDQRRVGHRLGEP